MTATRKTIAVIVFPISTPVHPVGTPVFLSSHSRNSSALTPMKYGQPILAVCRSAQTRWRRQKQNKVGRSLKNVPPKTSQVSHLTYAHPGCGPGGDRTLVQTGKQCAFYMLISVLIFECKPDRSHLLTPYLLKTSFQTRSCLKLFPIYLHHWIKTLRNHSF